MKYIILFINNCFSGNRLLLGLFNYLRHQLIVCLILFLQKREQRMQRDRRFRGRLQDFVQAKVHLPSTGCGFPRG